jgi:hypothetical protein
VANAATGPFSRVTVVSRTQTLRTNLPVKLHDEAPDLITLDRAPLKEDEFHWTHVAGTWEVGEVNPIFADRPEHRTSARKPKELYGRVGDSCRVRMACRSHQIFSLAVIVADKLLWVHGTVMV